MAYILLFITNLLVFFIIFINRNAVNNNARVQTLGVWITGSSMIFSLIFALITNDLVISKYATIFGMLTGISYAFGYLIIMFYCLKIGPSGPTVTINNLGLLWVVILGIVLDWNIKKPSIIVILGISDTISSLALISKNGNRNDKKNINTKWIKLIFLCFIFSGISNAASFLATRFDQKNSIAFTIAMQGTSFIILIIISCVKKTLRPNIIEIRSGILTGAITFINIPLIFYITTLIPGYLVFPIVSAGPIVLVLLFANFVYKERLNIFGWLSCVIGVAGIILMNF
ncbi:MAG: EamA family transporter [Clostridiales bacterium]|nr:EamA family transporter [Clostridiales bacterium]